MTRIVVSGLGVVSPYGAGVKTFWAGLAAGTCAIRPITLIETDGFRSRIAAEVPADTVAGLGVSARRTRADRLGLAAAREALADAVLSAPDRAETALVVGAVGGGMFEGEEWYWEETRNGRPSPRITALRSILPCTHAETLGFRLGLGGPKETVVMACASGAAAIALGADLIREGAASCALVGGVDALTRICFMGFNALRLLDPEPCRPFDRDRKGMSIGEAAAFLMLEDAERCRARGARHHGELLGAAVTTDAHHVTAPHPEGEGMVRAMTQALRAAQVAPHDIGYVNAHAPGTIQNDPGESAALREVFGPKGVPVSSTKAALGHAQGGANALEALACILALRHGLAPPTLNLARPDPALELDAIVVAPRPFEARYALSLASSLGGATSAIVLERGTA